nr:hypothetical protein [Tanacetum cinerariifolium]
MPSPLCYTIHQLLSGSWLLIAYGMKREPDIGKSVATSLTDNV